MSMKGKPHTAQFKHPRAPVAFADVALPPARLAPRHFAFALRSPAIRPLTLPIA